MFVYQKKGKICISPKDKPVADPGLTIETGEDNKIKLTVDEADIESGGGGDVEGTSVKSTGIESGKVLTANGEGGASWEDGGSGGTTVIANPTLTGNEDNLSGLQVGDTKYKLISLPAVTSADNGKVLIVKNGQWVVDFPPSDLDALMQEEF